MKQRWIGILWPGFLVAIPAVGVVFSILDPLDVHQLHGIAPLGIYTLGFLFFWILGAAASAIGLMLEDRR